jgi:phosphoribosyl-ATP pyrophosphohydrolase
MSENDKDIIDQVFATILSRQAADPQKSYVASLHKKGLRKIAEKVGEEAVETVVAAVGRNDKEVIAESADLLFHMMVLWAELGLSPNDIRDELARREGISGIDEKNSRPKG